MSFTTDLLTGIAERLHDAGVGVWRPDDVNTADEIAIVLRSLPTQPDRAIALATYDLGHDWTQPDSRIGLQVRIRGTRDPFVDQDIDDACFDVLHGLWAVEIGGVTVVSVSRESGASLGPDGEGRYERTSNYHVHAHRPSPNRT